MQAVRDKDEPTSAELLDRILDKGIVIDAWAMVVLAGLDFLKQAEATTVLLRELVAHLRQNRRHQDQFWP